MKNKWLGLIFNVTFSDIEFVSRNAAVTEDHWIFLKESKT